MRISEQLHRLVARRKNAVSERLQAKLEAVFRARSRSNCIASWRPARRDLATAPGETRSCALAAAGRTNPHPAKRRPGTAPGETRSCVPCAISEQLHRLVAPARRSSRRLQRNSKLRSRSGGRTNPRPAKRRPGTAPGETRSCVPCAISEQLHRLVAPRKTQLATAPGETRSCVRYAIAQQLHRLVAPRKTQLATAPGETRSCALAAAAAQIRAPQNAVPGRLPPKLEAASIRDLGATASPRGAAQECCLGTAPLKTSRSVKPPFHTATQRALQTSRPAAHASQLRAPPKMGRPGTAPAAPCQRLQPASTGITIPRASRAVLHPRAPRSRLRARARCPGQAQVPADVAAQRRAKRIGATATIPAIPHDVAIDRGSFQPQHRARPHDGSIRRTRRCQAARF
jgi:hypothetical protein